MVRKESHIKRIHHDKKNGMLIRGGKERTLASTTGCYILIECREP